MVSEDRLRTLLRVAESAHGAYEQELGRRDDDWPEWYARFIVERLQEDPEGVTHVVSLDDADHKLLVAAVHSYLDDFGHDEADVLRRLKDLHAKVAAA
jgi:hypothetical protein